jgi:hypothetical protein
MKGEMSTQLLGAFGIGAIVATVLLAAWLEVMGQVAEPTEATGTGVRSRPRRGAHRRPPRYSLKKQSRRVRLVLEVALAILAVASLVLTVARILLMTA